MNKVLKIDLTPEALEALEKDGKIVMPKTVHPSVRKAILKSLAVIVFGPKGKPTLRQQCFLSSSYFALNVGRR